MATKQRQPLELFRLKPAKAAAVSEISEATATSPVPPEERVNFHIGNPVQDERLVWAFFRIALGLEPGPAAGGQDSLEAILQETGGGPADTERLEFLLRLIKRSAPYTPRGGFLRNAPHPLALAFRRWVEKEQPDPMTYDLGEQSGVREVIFASGGITETLRVFLHAISMFLVHLPARLFLFHVTLPPHLSAFDQVRMESLPGEEQEALDAFHTSLLNAPGVPAFLAIGTLLREESRRRLRQLTLDHPVFIIEANDAPNNASLSREAHLSQRVLRFLTPGIFRPELAALPTVIVAGNADFIHILEVTHFQLKGTPSAPEIEMLTQILEQTGGPPPHTERDGAAGPAEPAAESLSVAPRFTNPLAPHTLPFAGRLTQATGRLGARLEALLEDMGERYEARVGIFLRRAAHHAPVIDPFSGTEFAELYDRLLDSGMLPEWQEQLQQAFLTAFLTHHPEYEPASSVAASGSSRTALGLLGFHCGIREVIIQDLSWTYEHCFPQVRSVPPGESLRLNVGGLIRAVEERLLQDPRWCEYGAVALNNPHNATGQAYDEGDVLRLLQWLLERNVAVIDDLAYQGVAPARSLGRLRTLRQLTDQLVRNGHLSAEQARRLVTVHSVSKTDSLAGSRLAVVEIRDPALREAFAAVNATITPNVGAIFLSYLFYRGSVDAVRGYWTLRNSIFEERMSAIEAAAANLPSERNRYGITIRRPAGSMYPLMRIGELPPGISLDWLSSGLARQGIGLLPLSAFARTAEGYEAGRRVFRLTLGGTDPAEVLLTKTRRVLIDLNRMLAEESSNYNRRRPSGLPEASLPGREGAAGELEAVISEVRAAAATLAARRRRIDGRWQDHCEQRLALFRERVRERTRLAGLLLARARSDGGRSLEGSLAAELYKDSLERRQEAFRARLFDRTVHPTQMYALQVEVLWDEAVRILLRGGSFPEGFAAILASALLDEYLGLNVAVTSQQEGAELVLDTNALLAAEDALHFMGRPDFMPFLSYWGDWDGSTRPSGQGHVLVASVLLENVRRMAVLLKALLRAAPSAPIDRRLVEESGRLDRNIRQFRKLLNEITYLTHQLERRYRGVLPLRLTSGMLRRAGIALHLASDPLTTLWQHNDRLERRMLTLRQKRKEGLQYYFTLNKSLRKALHASIPAVLENLQDPQLAIEAVLYRDLLKRVAITPRIHQRFITAQDQFAIDTTVHNIVEINEIAAASGNPGMILGLQISMTTSADAVIALDRKVRGEREGALRVSRQADLAPVWLIPLFEDLTAVEAIPEHLTKLWDYALQTRRLRQETRERFAEIISEVFIAGSDLSQQIGQTAGAAMFREAKQRIVAWLAERGLVGAVRIKMGSGEPMQRQGGYYAAQSGLPAFLPSASNAVRLAETLPASVKKSVEYATTPLMGVFAARDLRTVQSNLAEQLRLLPVTAYAELLRHMQEAQEFYERELARAAEPLLETRLRFASRGLQEIERLTVGSRDAVFSEFVKLTTENFRHIVYGKPEDVVGIHVVSYFIARTTPPLRDRPTLRPSRGTGEGAGSMDGRGRQILERIAETLPMSAHGSLLRAIAHNQAQTMVLGISQLTTGLFRALDLFAARQFPEGAGSTLLADRILPNLPVYEILQTLRLFQDIDQTRLRSIEHVLQAGNSALTALREDLDAMGRYLGPLRKELVRRHGLSVPHFFDGEQFQPELLPAVRPDLAVLLQPDLFNTDEGAFFEAFPGRTRQRRPDPAWKEEVARLLALPERIREWRYRAWQLLREPVFSRVSSFVELALALSTLSGRGPGLPPPLAASLPRKVRLTSPLGGNGAEDTMRQFLGAALEYLTDLSRQQIEVPTTVVRALQEVERIMKIEEQALPPAEQEKLRFYLLQIARLSGENG